MGNGEPASTGAGTTARLLRRAQGGDDSARDRLFAQVLPGLTRWARGRLPGWARGLASTADIVQESALSVFRRLDDFEPRHRGALQAYLRRAVVNRIRDECRRARRNPEGAPLEDEIESGEPSPLQQAIGGQLADRYLRALMRLRPVDQQAVVARLELGHSYEQVALLLGKPSADAARVAVNRALVRLVEELTADGGAPPER